MLFDAITPDTSSYMVAGYVIFLIIAAIYIASLYFRTRNLDRDLLALENLREEQEAQAKTETPASALGKPRKSKTNRNIAKKPQKKAARKR